MVSIDLLWFPNNITHLLSNVSKEIISTEESLLSYIKDEWSYFIFNKLGFEFVAASLIISKATFSMKSANLLCANLCTFF